VSGPSPFANPTDDDLRRIYAEIRTIAVVGASADPDKAAHMVPEYLQSWGYRVVPVNPRGGEILGRAVARSLREVDGPVDVVQVFRPPEEVPQIARDAAGIGASILWMQPGVVSEDGAELARQLGLTVAMDICMMHTHLRLGLGYRDSEE
jgi:predicted CoA-binding protein